jgi:predicted O-methyltransferase YrrM
MNPTLHALARATKGFMPDEEGMALFEAARQAGGLGLGPMLEVGAYCGKSTVYLGAGAAEAGTVLFSLDHHRGSAENQAGWEHHDPDLVDARTGRLNTLPHWQSTIESAGLEHCVVGVVGDSATVAAHWNTPLALVFIDGGHGSEPAWADYRGWASKVALGGTLAIHDVFPDPKDGGRPPFEIYCEAIRSGLFTETAAVGSLRLMRRRPVSE